MRILIDTNIFIPSEDMSISLDDKLAELHRLSSGNHQLLVHPGSRQDIKRDKSESRRKTMLERLQKYIELESAPALERDQEEALFGEPKKANDRVDNLILYALHQNCVHWLITQDNGIHKKARKISEYERVLTLDQAIQTLRKLHNEFIQLLPNIYHAPCHSLDLSNAFFDSLRSGYDGFNDWFLEKCAKAGRSCWVCKEDGDIHAIAIYKIEDSPMLTTEGYVASGKTLKICTFKVVKRGYKIGELLLKQIFNFVRDNDIAGCYVTIEPDKHELLEELFLEFGFGDVGTDDKGRDKVYLKVFPKQFKDNNDDPLEFSIKYFPAIKLDRNSGILIPIRPQYHNKLFPEISRQTDLFSSTDNSAGNAIKQAYLCNSPLKSVAPGDIVFFYRTSDDMAVTTYGIVDAYHIETEPDEIYKWVAKRTVYSYDEIGSMAGKAVKIILFRLVGHLESPVEFKTLKKMAIIKGPIQSMAKLSHENTKKLIEEAKINDCVLSD